MTADPDLGTPAVYVDTSVLVAALAPDEEHHKVARVWLQDHQEGLVTSVLAEVELMRALARRRASGRMLTVARGMLAGCELVDVTEEIRAAASDLQPSSLRTLDALHVATAVIAGLRVFATLDARQRVGADEAGLAPAGL